MKKLHEKKTILVIKGQKHSHSFTFRAIKTIEMPQNWLKVRKTRGHAHDSLKDWVKISFATPTFMFIEQHTHRLWKLDPFSPFFFFHLIHIFSIPQIFFFYGTQWLRMWHLWQMWRIQSSSIHKLECVFEWGLAYWHKIQQMGVCVGGPRNLPQEPALHSRHIWCFGVLLSVKPSFKYSLYI